jgi:GH35 family endo-1,4-beta-xylanase
MSTQDGAVGPTGVAAVPAVSDPSLGHRICSARLSVTDHSGQPLAGAEVTVEQTRHAFGFGNTASTFVTLANAAAPEPALRRLAQQWLELFNTATLGFYWARFEPRRGEPETDRLLRTARWLVERGVAVKGHPLLWHTLAPPWLRDSPLPEVEAAIRHRITREVTAFAGLVDLWDAINEVVIMPVFEKEENAVTRLAADRGRVAMVRLAFEAAREANPAARLVLNDFDLSADYERLIEECLAAGITIDALGLQTHMHQGYRGVDEIISTVDRFARFGLPIQLTETTLVSGELMPPHIVDLNDWRVPSWPSTPDGEARQADELVRHYRSLVGHPAVESITYWGLWDGDAWLGAPAGLVRADGSPKPSYDALHELIRGQWWLPPTTTRTDEDGRVHLRCFAGDYRLRHGDAASRVTIPAGDSTDEVPLVRA